MTHSRWTGPIALQDPWVWELKWQLPCCQALLTHKSQGQQRACRALRSHPEGEPCLGDGVGLKQGGGRALRGGLQWSRCGVKLAGTVLKAAGWKRKKCRPCLTWLRSVLQCSVIIREGPGQASYFSLIFPSGSLSSTCVPASAQGSVGPDPLWATPVVLLSLSSVSLKHKAQ